MNANQLNDQLQKTKSGFQTKVESELHSFRDFAFKDQMVKMAFVFVIATALQKILITFSETCVTPVMNYIVLQTGPGWKEYKFTVVDGMALEIGKLFGACVDFVVMAIAVYLLYQKVVLPFLNKKPIECIEVRECPKCFSTINYKSKRCSYCTSEIDK